MQEENALPISALFEKGYIEYLGLFLMFFGGLWTVLSVLEALQVVSFGVALFDRIAAIAVYILLGIYATSYLSSRKVLNSIREQQQKKEH
ncbi:hypothetical protein NEMIN01_0892 [Nematocida minor]|uniref:uncharacterized protein n=1 Tax=Nematocida minor TaxID=1912983 RepID=UPI0022205462|nr:uncharacterized protein NEMIN01_0892 [Nematocida minor]KAI5190193.1 hypothetical protein NEMIN01_0892 [Nematocida minor]